MNRDFTGLTADKILGNPVQDSYSWHVFQALSWIDYAKRNKAPSAIHYAAFELRYGIEYLLFQLLVLKNKFLTRTDYEKCIGDPREMKRRLANLGTNYQKLAEFTEMLLSLDPKAPKLVYWDISELFKYWGIASEHLHFMGSQSHTYKNPEWLPKAIARLEECLNKLWKEITSNLGFGLFDPAKMEPEVFAAWNDFSGKIISKEDLIMRMRFLKSMYEVRKTPLIQPPR